MLAPVNGEPVEIAAELLRYEATGISHIQLSVEPINLKTIETLGKVLEAIDSASG